MYAKLSSYSDDQLKAIKKLIVNSPINSADFSVIRKLCGDQVNDPTSWNQFGLDLLDLTNATIVGDNESSYDPYFKADNVICNTAFYSLANLAELKLPASATRIGYRVFMTATSGMIVHVPWTAPLSLDIDSSDDCDQFGSKTNPDVKNMTLVVPKGSLAAYQAAEGWNWFKEIIEEEESGTELSDENLTAALVPSKGEYLSFMDGDINDFSNESRVCQFTKGSDVVITPYNMSPSIFDVHLYINGVDRTEDLVDGVNGKELHLTNVAEDLLVEAKYELKKIDLVTFSTKGGTTSASYTRTDDETYSDIFNVDQMGRVYDIKPGTPVTFTFQPQEGYELDLVLYDYARSIFKGEGENSDFEVQLQADGSYKFVLPAEEFTKSNPSITVFYKKIGADVNYDVNGNGLVTIADVTKLVNVILGKE